MNQLAIIAIDSALNNTSYMQEYVNEVLKSSFPMLMKFLKKNNIKYWKSKANFILFYCKNSKKLTDELKKQ